jgi:PAS domain S-box-containing protein
LVEPHIPPSCSSGSSPHDPRSTQDIRRHLGQLAAINAVASAVSQSLDLEVTLQTALESVLSVIRVEAAAISLVDEAAGELVLRAQRGLDIDFVSDPMRIPLGEGMSGIVILTDEVLVTGDLSNDPRLAVSEFADEGVQAMVLVPMHAQRRVVGILSVMSHQPYEFSAGEIAMLHAIADQVGVALENARLYEASKEQSSRLSAVLHSSGDAIIATNNRGQISLINSTAEHLFDLRTQDLIGLPLRHAPLHPRLRDGLLQAMRNGPSRNTVFEATLEDGRLLSAIVSPVYSSRSPESDQQAEGWVMVVQDVTHLRQAEQARINFIHAAAHDLRNPLGVTLGALAMLERDLGDISDTHREIISIGVQGISRMQELIDSLLDLEHIQSGVGLQSKKVDVRELIERGIMDAHPLCRRRNQPLTVSVSDALPPILGDMHWLSRALTNLLNNASKYTPEGGEITLAAYRQDSSLVIEVQDTGPGIAPDVQARLFERFYRAPSTKDRVKGTGLGLSIVKSVVEQHGGRVFVQSKVGHGSTFGMVFPIADETDES